MSNDIYCDEILNGQLPVKKVIETERVLAFHHTRPSFEAHIVVIPKKHIPSLIELDEQDKDILTELLCVVQKVATQVNAEYGACGVETYMGEYQSSKHLHVHVRAGKQLRPTGALVK
ncbi:HIT domain-containing protein [Alicyclobacillus fastidiosus]|uniref:HIT domain-containing protein n=1 Tax=Alicyclobacillus fastidiosus TaxID=392011 RepID=A0ABY6ZB01_9BACL|nr:HIT domain-containing protein [Alicyclobacillus fastidiosus]WAH40065.1 HIT domain-containing protein [Alicyclobacillus fastidiosus]GMA61375.1 hydrolase [Alicyclobacillus fastidiosus]